MDKTIVAVATPPINGAIHIIRVSGGDTYKIVGSVCKNKIKKEGYSIQRNEIIDKNKIVDDVLLMKFVSPKSFTGDDLIEINCHGGMFIVNKIISLLVKNGATLAQRGEFTKRAFLNKKMSLVQADAINNLINSKNDLDLSAAHNGLNKKTTELLNKFAEDFFMLIGQVEVNIDYPEYDDIPNISKEDFIKKLEIIKNQLIKIISDSEEISKISKGINVAIVGKPNVGKSSLLNSLFKEDKAIVSNIPGTTRDAIESSININGMTFNFIDTAGIRKETKDTIEKIGIKKTIKMIEKADLVLFVVDGAKKEDKDDKLISNYAKTKDFIKVINKSDLIKNKKNNESSVYISAKKGDISALTKELVKKIPKLSIKEDSSILLQSSHSISIVKNVINKITESIKILKSAYQDQILENLKECYNSILQITGSNADVDFIEKMFEKFCLGK